MKEIEFIPVAELTTSEVETVGNQLYDIMTDDFKKELVRVFFLPGVVRRYSASREKAVSNVTRIREHGHEQGLGAFVISTGTDGKIETLGMATTQTNLKLFLPKFDSVSLPAKITRKSFMGISLAERVSTPPVNIAGWTNLESKESEGVLRDMVEVYSFLKEIAPQSWTLAPQQKQAVDPRVFINHRALVDAGYKATPTDYFRYDDLETGAIPPMRKLYVSN